MPNRHGTRREIKAFKRAEAEARAKYRNGILYKVPEGASTLDVSEWEEIGYIDEDPPTKFLGLPVIYDDRIPENVVYVGYHTIYPVHLDAFGPEWREAEMLDDEIHHGPQE